MRSSTVARWKTMPGVTNHSNVTAVELTSANGIGVTLVDRGAGIRSIRVPTAQGPIEACLGYERLADYLEDLNYLGTTVGRYANRIRNARFRLEGTSYVLDANDGASGNCLHGGREGLHRRRWTFDADGEAVEFRYRSPDGEGGFPGNLDITVRYQIVNDWSLQIDYAAVSDRDTVISLANHAYFNLDRHAETIDGHQLAVFADRYTPLDESNVPTGDICQVAGSRYDLRRPVDLGACPDTGKPLVFDNSFALPEPSGELRRVAEISAPGLRMALRTTQPALQVYTGDYLGLPFRPRQGLCLEAQGFPDAPNQPAFPSAQLVAGDCYRQRSVYEFTPESH